MAAENTTNKRVVIEDVKFLVRPLAARGAFHGAPENKHAPNMAIRRDIDKKACQVGGLQERLWRWRATGRATQQARAFRISRS